MAVTFSHVRRVSESVTRHHEHDADEENVVDYAYG
jgi:hypothetical protein